MPGLTPSADRAGLRPYIPGFGSSTGSYNLPHSRAPSLGQPVPEMLIGLGGFLHFTLMPGGKVSLTLLQQWQCLH